MKKGHLYCAALVLLSLTTRAATLNVPAQFITIQAAVDAGNAGDTVLVAPGIYTEAIVFKGKGVLIASSGGPEVTIVDPGTTHVAFTANQNETAASEIRGFTIRGAMNALYATSSSPTLSSNIVLNCSTGVETYFGSPIVRGNRFISCPRGFYLLGACTALIDGNLIADCFGEGGISMFGAGDPIIQKNVIRNSRVAITMVNRSDANILQNVIVQNSGNGIEALVPSGARGPVIRQNTIADNGQTAGAQILFRGFYADSVVANNLIVGRQGIVFDTDYGTYRPALRFNNVSAFQNYIGGVSDQTGINGNISAAPVFLNPALFDYRLQAGSPGIDRASASDMVTPDFDGATRPVEGDGVPPSSPDMGAFEFVPGPPRPATLLSAQSIPTGAIISWTPFDGALVYQLRRSLISGGPYSEVASTTATNYVDEGAQLYVTNYYVVAGGNSFNLGSNSTEVAIRAGNRPPQPVEDNAIIDEDTTLTIPLLANDSDPDGDAIAVTLLSANPPVPVLVSVSNEGLLTYRPPSNYFGSATVDYRASDSFGASATGRLSIVIRPVNDPPAAQNSLWMVPQGTNATISLSATDVDSTNLTFIITQQPQHGISFVGASSTTVWYQAEHGFSGTDTIRFVVSDGENLSEESFAVIQIPAPYDSDNDGMPEWWENFHDVNSPVADRDGDGFPNLFEYLANTSPNDSSSFLKVLSVVREPFGTRVSWSSIGGVRYRVLASDNLNSSFQPIERPASLEIDPTTYGRPSTHSFLDMRPLAPTGTRFYRVQVLNE